MRRSFLLRVFLLIVAIPVGALSCQCPYTSRCPYDSGYGDNVGQHNSQGVWYCDYEHKYQDEYGHSATHSFSKECH